MLERRRGNGSTNLSQFLDRDLTSRARGVPAGRWTRIEIAVMKPDTIGTITYIQVPPSHKSLERRDLCLPYGQRGPIPCPIQGA